MSSGITRKNLLCLLPPALTHDKSILALAEAGAEAMKKRLAEIGNARVIPNIDALPEAVLDILAKDFKVDWWDVDYSLEEKFRTLKDSWREWFGYGGKPYCFRLWINLIDDDINSERMRRLLDRLTYYKRPRSHADGFTELGTMPRVQSSVLNTGCVYSLDADVPAEKKPAPGYRARSGAGIAVKALKAAIHKEIDMSADIPEYKAGTKAGVGIGMLCASMDVFISQGG